MNNNLKDLFEDEIELQDSDIIEFEDIDDIPIIECDFEQDLRELCELTKKGLREKKENKDNNKLEILTTKEWYENFFVNKK
jgi:hypothetical protein